MKITFNLLLKNHNFTSRTSSRPLLVRHSADDLKSSHVDAKVNDKLLEWLNKKYGDETIRRVQARDKTIRRVQAKRGKRHDYLGMFLDYTAGPGILKVEMKDFI